MTSFRVSRKQPNAPGGVCIGFDLGSSGIRAAFSCSNGRPNPIPMGKYHDRYGVRTVSYKLPADIKFISRGKFELVGYREVTDFNNTSSGAKQSLDDQLCKLGGQGAAFKGLCRKYAVSNLDVLRELYKAGMQCVVEHLKSIGKLPIERINLTVPVMWTMNERGEKIQEQIRACAIQAGLPDQALHIDSEPGGTMAYLALLESLATRHSSGRRRRVLVIDIGAGTVDLAGAELEKGHVLAIREPVGCSGGMANMWRSLYQICQDKNPSAEYFLGARRHIHQMSQSCMDFTLDGNTITGDTIRSIIDNCYKDAIELAESEIHGIPNLDEITICGSAPASNKYVETLWRRHIEHCRSIIREEGGEANFEIRFVGSDIAAMAVSMGAAIPYSDDPKPDFGKRCFGFLCSDYKLQLALQPTAYEPQIPEGDQRECLLEVKPPNSSKIKSLWEKLTIHMDPGGFTLEPHIITNGKPLVRRSRDTGRRTWPTEHAMPMNPIEFNLSKHTQTGDEVSVRFTQRDQEKMVLEVKCPNGEVEKKDLKLCRDRDRLYFMEIDQEPAKDDGINRRKAGQQEIHRIRSDTEETSTMTGSAPPPGSVCRRKRTVANWYQRGGTNTKRRKQKET